MAKPTKVKLNPADIEKLEALPTRTGKLPTPAERERLKKQCNNRLNWSDGGHWIGSGREPNCFQSASIQGTQTLIYEFPTDQSAFKWNAEWEKMIRYAGHVATAAITTIVTLKTGGLGGIAIGTIAAITKDEIQARVPYPKVARGWKYVVTFSHVYKWSAHPWGANSFAQETSGTTYDAEGKQQYRTVSRVEFSLDEFPDDLAIDLASMAPRTVNIVYN